MEEQAVGPYDQRVSIRNGTVYTAATNKSYTVSMERLVGVSQAGDRLTFIHQGMGVVDVDFDPVGSAWYLDDANGSTRMTFKDSSDTITIQFDGVDRWLVITNNGVELHTTTDFPTE